MKLLTQIESAWKLNRVRELVAFILAFALVRIFLGVILEFTAVNWLGLPSHLLSSLVSDNEMAMQTCALLAGSFAVIRMKSSTSLFSFFKELIPAPSDVRASHGARVLSLLSDGFFKGACMASLGAGLFAFAGLGRFEGLFWDSSGFGKLLPLVLAQGALLFLWVLTIEKSRRLLWKPLVEASGDAFLGRLMLISFESHLLYRVFDPSNGSLEVSSTETALLVVISALLASSLLLWSEQGRLAPIENWRAAGLRVSLLSGFWFTVLNLYGYPMGNGRLTSLVHVIDGPVFESIENSSVSSVTMLALFVLLFVTLSNTLLQKAFRAQLNAPLAAIPGFRRSALQQVAPLAPTRKSVGPSAPMDRRDAIHINT